MEHAGEEIKNMTHRVDAIDEQNLTNSYNIIEGDALMGILELITGEVKVTTTHLMMTDLVRSRAPLMFNRSLLLSHLLNFQIQS